MLAQRVDPQSQLNASRALGVAVIGLGVGEQHARAYLGSGVCALRWLYDLDAARTRHARGALGQGSAAQSVDAILADPSVEVVSIASYDGDHFAQALAALQAGKHVFVEKPLCRSVTELRALKQAWQAHGYRHLASNLVLRAAPVYQWLKRTIEAGDLGEVYAFDGEYLYGRLHKMTEGWRKDVQGYSVMQGGGVHLIDLMLWLTGQKPVSVTAVGNRICTADTAFAYNDYMAATFQFSSGRSGPPSGPPGGGPSPPSCGGVSSGLIGRVTANFGCLHRHQHVVRVFGTKATFLYDDCGPRLHTSRDPAEPATTLQLPALPASKGELIPGFIKAILNGDAPHAQAQHEFDVISACVAADEAAASAKLVEITYV